MFRVWLFTCAGTLQLNNLLTLTLTCYGLPAGGGRLQRNSKWGNIPLQHRPRPERRPHIGHIIIMNLIIIVIIVIIATVFIFIAFIFRSRCIRLMAVVVHLSHSCTSCSTDFLHRPNSFGSPASHFHLHYSSLYHQSYLFKHFHHYLSCPMPNLVSPSGGRSRGTH